MINQAINRLRNLYSVKWAAVAGALLTAMMILAPKSVAGVLVLGALVSIFVVSRTVALQAALAHAARRPENIGIALLAGVILVSVEWHFSGEISYASALNTAMILGGGVLSMLWWQCAESIPSSQCQEIGIGIAVGVSLGTFGLWVAYGYAALSGDSLWGDYYYDPLSPLNNSAVMLALFIWPAVTIRTQLSVWWMALLVLPTLGVLALLSSAAALSAALIGILIFVVRRVTGQRIAVAMVFILVFIAMAAPYGIKSSSVAAFVPTKEDIASNSSALAPSFQHRLVMWSFVADRIDERPWLGWGFDASRVIPQEAYRLAPNMEIMPLHPHNLSLQTRLELGIPGVLVVGILMIAVLVPLTRYADSKFISGVMLASAIGWIFIANVSFGMWQTWWVSTAFVLANFMRICVRSRDEV
tara:strand:+ start:42348 stop:43592 length:1245 start_codon:yes stop_codon:yes gene_type:complete